MSHVLINVNTASPGNSLTGLLSWPPLSVTIDNYSNQYLLEAFSGRYSSPGLTGVTFPIAQGLPTNPNYQLSLMAPQGVAQATPASGQIVVTYSDEQNSPASGVLSTLAITPTGPAIGDLSGTYPGPTVAKIQGRALSAAAPSDGFFLKWVAANNDWESASVTTLLNFGSGNSIANSTVYFPPTSGNNPTEANAQLPMSEAVTFTKLYINVTAPPGAGETFAFTLRKNGVSQPITATISGAVATTANDTAHSVAFVAGDLIDIMVVGSVGAAAAIAFMQLGT